MRAMRGFTLHELMVVLVILSVLGLVAYPRYETHLVKSRRVGAIACLLESRLLVEAGFAQSPVPEDVALAPCARSLAPHYRIHLEKEEGWKYRIIADAQGRQMLQDPHCRRLVIDQAGRHEGASGNAPSEPCWPR